jgi:hypothetical protein
MADRRDRIILSLGGVRRLIRQPLPPLAGRSIDPFLSIAREA